jgi:hypothetical protein
MSLSGVLFETTEPLSAQEAVELLIMFQAPGRCLASSVVTTGGYVVRSEQNMPPRVAVKFEPVP